MSKNVCKYLKFHKEDMRKNDANKVSKSHPISNRNRDSTSSWNGMCGTVKMY